MCHTRSKYSLIPEAWMTPLSITIIHTHRTALCKRHFVRRLKHFESGVSGTTKFIYNRYSVISYTAHTNHTTINHISYQHLSYQIIIQHNVPISHPNPTVPRSNTPSPTILRTRRHRAKLFRRRPIPTSSSKPNFLQHVCQICLRILDPTEGICKCTRKEGVVL